MLHFSDIKLVYGVFEHDAELKIINSDDEDLFCDVDRPMFIVTEEYEQSSRDAGNAKESDLYDVVNLLFKGVFNSPNLALLCIILRLVSAPRSILVFEEEDDK